MGRHGMGLGGLGLLVLGCAALACGGSSETTGGGGGGGSGAGGGSGSGGWVAPLGVPEPDFGVREQAPAPPDEWTDAVDGFYYVEISHAAATDEGNPYGSPALPRRSIPSDLPAGSVVFVHGGPYAEELTISAVGTAAEPIFVGAFDAEAPPLVSAPVTIQGTYLVVEHFDFNGPDCGVSVATPSDHVAVRRSEIHDGEGGPSAGLYTGRWNPEDEPAVASHIVFFANRIHDNGDVNADFDEDHHGIAIGHHAEWIWVLDNELARNSGDGIQINAKKAGLASSLHHVFVGGNVAHENKQTGFWTKQAEDVVFSQNESWGHQPSNSSGGAGIGFQYGPERVWILFNHVHDGTNGITSSTYEGDVDNVPGAGQDIYLVGNVLHGLHKPDGSGPSTDPWQDGAGIRLTDEQAHKHVLYNTIVDTDVGLSYVRGTGPLDAVDNLLADVAGWHVCIEESAPAGVSTLHHDLFDATARLRWGTSDTYDLAGLQGAFSGLCDGCLAADPGFVDGPGGDYHLQASSPAVDAGIATDIEALYESLYGVSLALDYDGAARPQGGGPDLGAFER